MALPENAIIEATYEGVIHNQRCLSVYHYRVEELSSETTIAGEMTQFLDAFTSNNVGDLMTTYLVFVPENYELIRAVAQPIYPTRYRRFIATVGGTGAGSPSPVTNVQGSITTASPLAGRRYIGGKRLCVSPTDCENGNLKAATKTILLAHSDAMLEDLQPDAGNGVYRPVIFHRSPNINPRYSDMTIAFPQETARVIRRRTVGLGI